MVMSTILHHTKSVHDSWIQLCVSVVCDVWKIHKTGSTICQNIQSVDILGTKFVLNARNLSTEKMPILKRVVRAGLRADYHQIPLGPSADIANNM